MTLVLVLSIVMAAAGCTGLILAGKGKWQGWAIGLAIQPVWALFAILTEGYGLLITCIMYGTVYAKNLLAWRKKKNEKKDVAMRSVQSGFMSANEAREVWRNK